MAPRRMEMQMQDQLLTRDEVAAFFGGLHYSTIYRGIRKGRYPRPVNGPS